MKINYLNKNILRIGSSKSDNITFSKQKFVKITENMLEISFDIAQKKYYA